MSIWTSLEPASTTVDPGSTATVRLRLRNTGDVVDEYRFTPVGPVAPWTTVEPPTLRLYPGTTGTVQLTFAPPRTPDATAGPNPYAVQIIPTEHPEATTVPEGNLTLTPFTQIQAELVPPTCRGRFRGRPKLAIDNLGNTKLTASIGGRDNGDQLSYDIHPGNVQIEPGRAAFVRAHLRPRQITWFGQKQTRPFTLAVRRSGHTPVDVDGIYIQRGVLPRWLATLLSLATALAVTCIALWFAYAPAVHSNATELIPEAASSPLPTPTLSSAPAPAAAAPPQQAPAGGGSRSAPSPSAPSNPNAASNQSADDRQVTLESGQNLYLLTGREPMSNGSPFLTAPWDSQAWSNTYYSVFRYPDDSIGIEVLRRPGSVIEEQPDPNVQPLHDIQLTNGVQDLKNGKLSSAQRWNLVPVGNGYFQIVNQKTGDCLTDQTTLPVNPDAAGFAAARPCASGVTDQQRWMFTPAGN
ncbi:MAG: RICIN domain-containing protein [Streptomycetaceae bacterium]|nr:RICIN domain-containing protein [Streptomycetaceae bacterium]